MDPLSIAASACGIAALCGTIISRIGTFCADIKALPQNLEEFTTNISTLRSALEGVDHVVSKGPKHLVFAQKQERKHWQDVKNVLEACNNCLYKLRKEIPELPADKHRLLQQARIQLEVTLKSNVVMQIRGHISSYTQVLQLSLTTMTLGSIWEQHESQDLVRAEIQKLTSEIRTTNAIIQRRRFEVESKPCDELTLPEMLATQNIEAWRESAENLAATITLYQPDQQSLAERAEDASIWSDVGPVNRDEINGHEPTLDLNCRRTSMSHDDSGIEVDEDESVWEPEPDNTYSLGVEIMQCQIAANQENVKRLLNDGLYGPAERYQVKGIHLQDQLLKNHKIPFTSRPDAEETLADILRRQGRRNSLKRAKEILQKLLEQEVQGEHPLEEDKSRCWRLYHKLSEIYLELGFIPKAKIFATRALEGRKKLIPAQMHEIFETANLLANACQLNQDYDEASGIRTWIYQKEVGTRKISRTESLKSNPPMADVLHWCKERGFDVDSPNFRFEHPNADGKTPLHIAISDEKLEIVEVITNHVQTLETRDNDSATGLLLACSTRNRRTTEVLLRKGAKVGVQDMYLNTPLHRVQSAEKGIAVAQLLLKYPNRPIDINQKNIYDKTALHLACEMANEPMVDLLLDHGADPNCPGPAKCTPLHVSIYSRRISIVKKLLERGADTALRDSRGLDAITAANTTKLASQNIIKLVLDHEHRVEQDRLRRLSQTRSLETPSGERRKSSTASELTRLETSGSSGQSGGQIRKQSSPSSLPRKDTIYSQSSSGSGGSTGEKEPTSPSETSSSKSSMSLKLPFRRFKASND